MYLLFKVGLVNVKGDSLNLKVILIWLLRDFL